MDDARDGLIDEKDAVRTAHDAEVVRLQVELQTQRDFHGHTLNDNTAPLQRIDGDVRAVYQEVIKLMSM